MLRLAVVLMLGVLAQQILADEPEAIVGGTRASPTDFPHQCSLRFMGSHMCGGSIITSTKILTAAHCVEYLARAHKDLKVVTGTIDNRAGNAHSVKSIHVHPNYNSGLKWSWENDIAMITLNTPIQFDEFQNVIPVTSSPPTRGTQCTLSGWGKTQTNGYIPQYLMKMPTTLLERNDCQKRFGSQPITESHLCALTTRGIGACQGDSGGPLICNGQQYGVVSFVVPCALGIPDVYTSVYHHRDFIRRCIKEN